MTENNDPAVNAYHFDLAHLRGLSADEMVSFTLPADEMIFAFEEAAKAIASQDVLTMLCQAASENAQAKGWYETDRGFPEEIALIHSEVTEALEEYRNGRQFHETYYRGADGEESVIGHEVNGAPRKTEGIAAELADVLIRVFDVCGKRGIPLAHAVIHKMTYNATRPARHGGKKA